MKCNIAGKCLIRGRKSGTAVHFWVVLTYVALQNWALRSVAHDECNKPFAIHHLESFIVIAKWN